MFGKSLNIFANLVQRDYEKKSRFMNNRKRNNFIERFYDAVNVKPFSIPIKFPNTRTKPH